MSWRALVLGGLLAVAIASLTYFNDQVIRQTYLIGNHLPASVFGVGLILLLGINPLLGLIRRRWQLRAGEVALVVAMGLAVCAWPGSNLLRIFTSLVFEPTRPSQVQTSWQATDALSYTPGVSSRLAGGYVTNWPRLITLLDDAGQDESSAAAKRVHTRLPPALRARLDRLADQGRDKPSQTDRRRVLRGLNRIIEDPTFYGPGAFDESDLPADLQRLITKRRAHGLSPPDISSLNRALLAQTFPGVFNPPPQGQGVLLSNGDPPPRVADPLVVGSPALDLDQSTNMPWWAWQARLDKLQRIVQHYGPTQVPWSAWWPTLRLWLGLALAVGLAGACLMLVVHRQWTHHERLPYPIVQFLGELTHTQSPRILPSITRNRLFWLGLAIVGLIHLSNGLHAWFEPWVQIPLGLDFSGLRDLLPNASRVEGSDEFFMPVIYPAVIGFGFFVSTRVAASIGLSLFAWLILGAYLVSSGLAIESGRFNIGANATALRFGAYAALTLMILYFGRKFYWRVALGALGLDWLAQRLGSLFTHRPIARARTHQSRHAPAHDQDPDQGRPPAYATWGARGMVLATAAGVYLLVRFAGLNWPMALLLIALVLMILLVLARINVETGLFYAQPGFLPATILAGLLGIEGIGPEALIVLMIASTVLVIDPRTAISPFIANGLKMTEQLGDTPPRRSAWPIGVCIVLGLIVATIATLTIQYNLGLSTQDGWANGLPIWAYNRFADSLSQLDSLGQLQQVTAAGTWSRLSLARPDSAVVTWALLGLGLTLVCSIGRIRFPWWPIHPVLFAVWGTYPANHFAFSFLLAAAIKTGVLRTGGIRAFDNLKPFMVGLIVADILAVLAWSAVGALYYLNTGFTPETYRIFPG